MILKYRFEDVNGKVRTIEVGDEVVWTNGKKGFIDYICDCECCAGRGFFEPVVHDENNNYIDHITYSDYKTGFDTIYKIGKEFFNAPYIEFLETKIKELKEQIKENETEIKRIQDFIKEVKGEMI